MGSEFWHEFTPYREDAAATLRELQQRVLREGKYLSLATKQEAIVELRETIEELRNSRKDTDDDLSSDLLAEYEQQLEALSGVPAPQTLQEKIQEIMTINGPDGTRSPLDLIGVSSEPEFMKANPFPQDELEEVFGSDQPVREQVEQNIAELADRCDRGFGVYVVVYRDGKPSEICFGGWSFD